MPPLWLLTAWMTVWLALANAQDLSPIIDKIGGTFCQFLAQKSQIHRSYLWKCPKPTCAWDNWAEALEKHSNNTARTRVVLSIGHNGFGNQLWQHTAAFMIAESLKARLFITMIPEELSPNGVTPPNTFAGMNAMERLLPSEFQYQLLPLNSTYRELCDREPYIVFDRPIDWRNGTYTKDFKKNLLDIITDTNPRCIKFLGYFQNLPLCADDARRLWTPRMFSNNTMKPGEHDISIYLRCMPRHYFFNSPEFYEHILNRTSHDKVWLFMAPECPSHIGKDPKQDGIVTSVLRVLYEKYNATKWPSIVSEDDTAHLLHDLAGLAQSKKLIIPVSSWAYWAGLFSDAVEIHVNAPPHHPVMSAMAHYVYHDEKNKNYYGKFNTTEGDIVYQLIKPNATEFHRRRSGDHMRKNHTAAMFGNNSHPHGHKHSNHLHHHHGHSLHLTHLNNSGITDKTVRISAPLIHAYNDSISANTTLTATNESLPLHP